MSTAKGMAGITAAMGSLACVAALAVAWPAHGATPLRSYATEWNREAQGITTAQKEALITAILDQWQPAALRFGADAKTWRDSFGLQLSMLPGSKSSVRCSTHQSVSAVVLLKRMSTSRWRPDSRTLIG